MAKEVGAEALGRFFTDGKVRSRREWRITHAGSIL